ncbi:MAG: hypothetical protein ACE5EI_03500 [Thermodesulfobacteriota bacterium]
MGFFIVAGILSLSVGFLFIVSPNTIRRINEAGTRMITNIDSAVFSRRLGVGVTLMISSLLFFFVAYYMYARG